MVPNQQRHLTRWEMSHLVTKPTKGPVRPAMTQISLGVRPVWSGSSLSGWRKLGSLANHWAHSVDSNQTGRMPRLIWVFAGRTSFCCFWHEVAQILLTVKFDVLRARQVPTKIHISPTPGVHGRLIAQLFQQRLKSLSSTCFTPGTQLLVILTYIKVRFWSLRKQSETLKCP